MQNLSPSKGDKIDFSGKVPQIEFFIDKTYHLLIQNSLDWIKIGDPKAGILDDIQYATLDEIHAYQMKWSNQDKMPTFSYKVFRNLIGDLIESWKKLCKNNPDKRVFAHIITSQKPSENDILKLKETKIGTFRDFLAEYYQKIREEKPISKKWSSFISNELSELGILESEFKKFLKNLVFEFSEIRPNYSSDMNYSQIELNYNSYTKFILDEYYNLKSKIKFTARELKKVLSLEADTIFHHDFWVDLDIYTPNSETIKELNEMIENQSGGYILLSGKPGTGKSTLLTEWLKKRTERIIKYYAYSNKYKIENYPERGSAKNLFFDLVFQIAELGFYHEKVYPYRGSIEQIHSTFIRQLSLLHQEYKSKGEKTIIIIDGLDHIPREYGNINDSLLKYLPPPSEIPEGVFIILGSQTYQLADLDISIRNLQNDSKRSISIKSLSFDIVNSIISKSINVDEIIKEKIFKISEGHPLYLNFILKIVKESQDKEAVLENLRPINDIVEYYERVWKNYEDNDDLISILGLIVRLRFGFDERFLKEWNIRRSVQTQLFYFFHQFFDNSFDTWTIFHNSFRQFLLEKTIITPFNKIDDNLELEYHQKLAQYAKSTSVFALNFDRLYHLFEAGQYDDFIELSNHQYFQSQVENLRPYYFVFEDLKMGQIIASEKQDVKLLLRFAFLSAEFSRREWNFNQDRFLDFSSTIIGNDTIKQFIFLPSDDTETLKLKMKLARFIHSNGKESDAKLLFRMAQPIEITENGILIDNNRRAGYGNKVDELLKEWVLVAHYFSSIEDVIAKIKNLSLADENKKPHNNYYQKESSRLKSDLILGLFEFLINAKEGKKIKQLIKCFNFNKNFDFSFNTLEEITFYFLKENDSASANDILFLLLKVVKGKELSFYHKIRLAYLILNTSGDEQQIRELIEGIEIIQLKSELEKERSDSYLIYWLIILYLKIGIPFDFATIFALTKNEEMNIKIEFERILYYLAKLKVDLDVNETFDIRRVYPIVRYFYQEHDIIKNRTWSDIIGRRENIMLRLVETLGSSGTKNTEKLWHFLSSEFETYPKFWKSFDLRIKIVIQLFRGGFSDIETKKKLLEYSEKSVNQESSLDERISQSLKIAEYWVELNDIDMSKLWLKKAYNESLGIGYRKDYQLEYWTKWIRKINRYEPQNAYQRLQWLNSINNHINYTTENAGTDIADFTLKELLMVNLFDGITQMKWQIENNLYDYTSTLNIFIEKTLEQTTFHDFSILLDLWGKLYIYIHNYSDTDLLQKLINRAEKLFSTSEFDEFLSKLRYYLSIYPTYELRQSYYNLLYSLNIDFDDNFELQEIEEKAKEEKYLKLTDGQTFTTEDLKSKIKNFEDLLFYFNNQEFTYSYGFNWKPIFSFFQTYFTESNFKILSETLKGKNIARETIIFDMVEFSISKGYDYTGRELIYQILGNKGNTWIKSYDGAKRLQAFKWLIEIDGEKIRKEAFADYALKTIESNSSDLFEIEEILEVIKPDFDDKDVCFEIKFYLERLLSTAEVNPNLPLLSKKEISLSYGIADLLIFYANQNNLTLSQTAISIYINWLSNEDMGFVVRLQEYCLETSHKSQLNTIQILYCAFDTNQSVIKNFINELKILVNSKLFGVSNKAKEMLFELSDFDEDFVSFILKEQNWNIYRNKLLINQDGFNEFEQIFKNEEISLDEVKYKLKYCTSVLESILKLDKNVWESKLLRIIKELEVDADYTSFNIIYDRNTSFDNSRLILSFVISRLAINILLKELYDLGIREHYELFEIMSNSLDSNFWLLEPQKQPDFINGIIYEGFKKDKSNFYGLESNWYEKVEDAINVYQNKFDDFVVLAEYTTFRCLGGNWEREDRNCFISRKKFQKFKRYIPFEVVYDKKLMDYPFYYDTNEFVLFNWHEFEHRIPDKILNWLAFNPKIALEMGWEYEENGLFRWIDSEGNLMVESIYWINGNLRSVKHHSKSEVGSGWLVKASIEAFRQLKAKYAPIFQNIAFDRTRTKRQDGSENEKSANRIVEL